MPSIVGPIKINNNSGVINLGDSFNISPKNISKSTTGAGGGGTGDFHSVVNGASVNNTFDPDLIDQNSSGNN